MHVARGAVRFCRWWKAQNGLLQSKKTRVLKMSSLFLRICIGLFLIFTAFLPSACSQKASTIMGYKQGTEIAIPTETQLLNHPSLPTITRMPTKSPANVSNIPQTSQSTTQKIKKINQRPHLHRFVPPGSIRSKNIHKTDGKICQV